MRTSTLRKLVAGCTFALGLAFVPSLQAQGGGGGRQMGTPEERATAQVTQLTTVLALTADQATKIKPILVKQLTDQAAAMAGMQQGGDMAAMRAANQERTTRAQAAIAAVLTAEQKTKYTAYLAEQATRRGPGGQGGGAPRQQ
jgi:hypothetical protein